MADAAKKILQVSRTQLELWLKCRRKWLKRYVEKKKSEGVALPLFTGSSIHRGLEILLKAPVINSLVEEEAVSAALSYAPISSIEMLPWEVSISRLRREILYLIEVWVRMAARRVVPDVLKEWDVLRDKNGKPRVEYKYNLPILDGRAEFVSIADSELNAAVVNKFEGYQMAMSWKTTEQFPMWKLDKGLQDMQGLSEPWAINTTTGENFCGAVMCWLLTGKTRDDRKKGLRFKESPLVSPYQYKGEWYSTYSWVEAGEERRLSSLAKRVSLVDVMSPLEWADLLSSGEVHPKSVDAIRSQYVGPTRFFRSPGHIKRWEREMLSNVETMADGMDALKKTKKATEYEEVSSKYFYAGNPDECVSCEFNMECWG